MNAKHANPWPNGLGWDIGETCEVMDGTASIPMRCRITLSDRHETNDTGRRVCIQRIKYGEFPLGTDPLECYRATRRTGKTIEH